jgi:hypothetical protein
MSQSRSNLEEIFEPGHAAQAGLIPEPPPVRRAFISAPASVDTGVIRQALESRGFAPYELDDVDTVGVSMPDLLEDCLKRADLVIAVLGGGKLGDNVLFELGYAAALKKRILALVPRDEELPISEIPYLRAQADNREAIDFGIDQILNAPRPRGETPRDEIQKTKPIGPLADELLSRVRGAGALSREDLEEVIRAAIAASGGAIISSSSVWSQSGDQAHLDLAIWSDDFEPWIGNPLMIGVDSALRDRLALKVALDQLTRSLDDTHTGWGLLIYRGPDFPLDDEVALHPRVFVLKLEQFLDKLRETGLGDLLRGLRKLRVHGRG